jgi:hypothetical protein
MEVSTSKVTLKQLLLPLVTAVHVLVEIGAPVEIGAAALIGRIFNATYDLEINLATSLVDMLHVYFLSIKNKYLSKIKIIKSQKKFKFKKKIFIY